jgi:hypothetical protein
MVFRAPRAAPASRIPPDRRGHVVGRYCHGCNQVYPLQRAWHTGDPIHGRDHVASTCTYEGWRFEPEASWWEPAVEVLPAPAAAPAAAGAPTPAAAPPAPAGPPASAAPAGGVAKP